MQGRVIEVSNSVDKRASSAWRGSIRGAVGGDGSRHSRRRHDWMRLVRAGENPAVVVEDMAAARKTSVFVVDDQIVVSGCCCDHGKLGSLCFGHRWRVDRPRCGTGVREGGEGGLGSAWMMVCKEGDCGDGTGAVQMRETPEARDRSPIGMQSRGGEPAGPWGDARGKSLAGVVDGG